MGDRDRLHTFDRIGALVSLREWGVYRVNEFGGSDQVHAGHQVHMKVPRHFRSAIGSRVMHGG